MGSSKINLVLIREMEYIERASFVEIYGLKLAYPMSLLSLAGIFAKFNGWNFQWLEFQTVEIFSTD